MFTRIRNMHPVTGIVIGVVATLVLSGTAMAITDTSFTYSTPQTGYLMLGPGDLVPEDGIDANNYVVTHVSAESTAGACFRAPVHLPHGSRMTSVRTFYLSGAASDLYLRLYRANPANGVVNGLIDHLVPNDSATRTFVNDTIPANLGLVSTALHTHTYQVCVGSGDQFFGARIAYTYTNAGD